MIKTIRVNEEVTKDIQKKEYAMQSTKDILTNLINMHIYDSDTSFMSSPVFLELQKESEQKQLEWEKAKDNMVAQYIPAEEQSKVKQWTLDYFASELRIEF